VTFLIDMDLKGTKGVQELSKDVQRDLGPSGFRSRLKDAAKLILRDAKKRTHSSRVKKAITSEVNVTSSKEFEARIGTERKKAFFAHFLEFGTSHSRKFPFMLPALLANKERVVSLVGKLPSLK